MAVPKTGQVGRIPCNLQETVNIRILTACSGAAGCQPRPGHRGGGVGKRYTEISPRLKAFIETQKLFFVATATADSRINISPKGMDSLRVLDGNRVVWLNLTGSGNETAAHVRENSRMTLMFAAFSGEPLILRLYGKAKTINRHMPEWDALFPLFPPLPGARQLFDLQVDLVQTSCGMGVPFFDYAGDREDLNAWAIRKGAEGIEQYWQEKNCMSIDGKDIDSP